MPATYDKFEYDCNGVKYIAIVWHDDVKHLRSKINVQRKCSYEDIGKFYNAKSTDNGFEIYHNLDKVGVVDSTDINYIIELLETQFNCTINN